MGVGAGGNMEKRVLVTYYIPKYVYLTDSHSDRPPEPPPRAQIAYPGVGHGLRTCDLGSDAKLAIQS